MIESFKAITDYCTRAGKGPQVRNHSYCLFVSTLERALDEHTAANGANPKPKEIADKKSALLTSDAIEGYVARAEALVDAAAIELRAPYEKVFHAKRFWLSVAASTIGALFYSLMLVLMFWLARDQIDAWLVQLIGK